MLTLRPVRAGEPTLTVRGCKGESNASQPQIPLADPGRSTRDRAGLLLATGALAAHPKAGKTYSGYNSAAKVNGFRAPVSFKVSSNGTKLLGFQYGTVGCFPTQHVPHGNPYTKASSKASTNIKVGTIAVSGNGSFSVKNAKYVVKQVLTETTTSTVTGKFSTAKAASSTITISQTLTGPHFPPGHKCGPFHLTFTATTK
jgi:hypothetical protein